MSTRVTIRIDGSACYIDDEPDENGVHHGEWKHSEVPVSAVWNDEDCEWEEWHPPDPEPRRRRERGEPMSDIEYEPTREHWTPYEPWMRDVLADDARVSWLGYGAERRGLWVTRRHEADGWLAAHDVRVHPDDVPEQPAEDDPDEARALDGGDVTSEELMTDAIESRVRAEYRAEKAEAAMRAEVKDNDATRARAEKAEAEIADERDRHNATLIERERLLTALADMTRQRDEWRARHAALRADVDGLRRDDHGWPSLTRILDRDAAREPRDLTDETPEVHDPDTEEHVTWTEDKPGAEYEAGESKVGLTANLVAGVVTGNGSEDYFLGDDGDASRDLNLVNVGDQTIKATVRVNNVEVETRTFKVIEVSPKEVN